MIPGFFNPEKRQAEHNLQWFYNAMIAGFEWFLNGGFIPEKTLCFYNFFFEWKNVLREEGMAGNGKYCRRFYDSGKIFHCVG